MYARAVRNAIIDTYSFTKNIEAGKLLALTCFSFFEI